MSELRRRYPAGAEVQPDGSTHFRVWAPEPRQILLRIERRDDTPRDIALDKEVDGYYSAVVAGAAAGTRYRYVLDGDPLPDPASRFQPDGPFGPSEVIDPSRFSWEQRLRPRVELAGQILYEMHPGTFTPEGTWRSAIEKLPLLADVGITALEVMPISDFPGRFGWGYDGVFPYAPAHQYGTPDDFRAFVDRAHGIGLGTLPDYGGCTTRAHSRVRSPTYAEPCAPRLTAPLDRWVGATRTPNREVRDIPRGTGTTP